MCLETVCGVQAPHDEIRMISGSERGRGGGARRTVARSARRATADCTGAKTAFGWDFSRLRRKPQPGRLLVPAGLDDLEQLADPHGVVRLGVVEDGGLVEIRPPGA